MSDEPESEKVQGHEWEQVNKLVVYQQVAEEAKKEDEIQDN